MGSRVSPSPSPKNVTAKPFPGWVPGGLRELRRVLRLLPPAKGCDVRNNFLRLVERTAGQQPSDLVDGPDAGGPRPAPAYVGECSDLAAAEALWQGGLRLGSALGLEPWKDFANE